MTDTPKSILRLALLVLVCAWAGQAQVARWDRIIVANAGQAWVRDQQTRRDRMPRLLFEQTRQKRDETAAVEP